ncbi:Beta-glucuronidase [Hypsizygus marmoreus]|uniref:Beta-glucuronidase n=1 Tax=Hypsizygus marmoreus TaxID=39966 RepID=A0A369J8H5_HYPMA|nr:Beta-glucuronidase [Hypsizygus marmoreus]
MLSLVLCSLCSLMVKVDAGVTVYGQIPLALQTTASAADAAATGKVLPAYDQTLLSPPALPDPRPPTAFTLTLPAQNGSVIGLSIPQHGSFFGFSIEMSVINQILGKNSSHINVPFLNLMSNIHQRAGAIDVRLGGNTQEFAKLVDDSSIPNFAAVSKEKTNLKNPTLTPAVIYTKDLFYLVANITALVNVRCPTGIPFATYNGTGWSLEIAELGQEILGDHLLGLQGGNEPDLYAAHNHRPKSYTPADYFGEFGSLVKAIAEDDKIPRKNMLIGPSLASAAWTLEQVWDTGYINAYSDSLSILTIENYPNNNCAAQYGLGTPRDPQTEFPKYLNHDSGLNIIKPFLNSSAIAHAAGKPFIMFETNSASCGGFPGISDSFGAGLWALDYGLTMAAANFSGAMLHVGGQNVFYNPFTAPPTNQTLFHQWTAGAVYYSVLIAAEVFGSTNTSQILDTSNNGIFTPSYSIYENGALARVALFNYNNDASGASDITATVKVDGGTVPAQVLVKYFAGESVSVKTNLTWAGQTLGNKYEVDGRLKGQLDVKTITCDQGANACLIPVKAPGFALVFLTESPAVQDDTPPTTFATTAVTRMFNTATVDPAILATSNGISGKQRQKNHLGSTSKGALLAANGNAGSGLRTYTPGIFGLSLVVGAALIAMRVVVAGC